VADCGGRTVNEVRSLYGLQDESIPKERADEVVHSVFQLFGKPINENILKEEFVRLLESGGDLPDCEFDGHHGDEEWEVIHPEPSLYINHTRTSSSNIVLDLFFYHRGYSNILHFGNDIDGSLKYIMWSNSI
jgi:hypothetical protein